MEQVLTIPRALFDQIGSFQGFTAEADKYLPHFFTPPHAQFIDREKAETDPSYKQLIPYCLLINDHGDILRYQRGGKSGEKRLASKYSIGIGGHINPIDSISGGFDRQAYENCVARELQEELSFEHTPLDSKIVGLINDDSNAVGAVHLGVVEIFLVQGKISPQEESIVNPEFYSRETLLREQGAFETWSQIVLDHLDEILE